jgi:hypothetical protein
VPATQTKPRIPLAVRLLAVPVVVVVLLVGIWIAGGVITNDFGLAMALTIAWMGLAGAACLAVAWRWRGLGAPVIGAYLVTAAVVGVYLGRSMFLDDEVNEPVVIAAPAPEASRADGGAPAAPRNELLARGRFESVAHSARGTASAIRTARGRAVLTLTSFEVDNGPDLRVYLVAGPARDESEVDDFKDLGGLKGNKGNQQYEIPRGVDVNRYSTVVIWCRAFSVNFARAPLR